LLVLQATCIRFQSTTLANPHQCVLPVRSIRSMPLAV
jgi:hypothetical protein